MENGKSHAFSSETRWLFSEGRLLLAARRAMFSAPRRRKRLDGYVARNENFVLVLPNSDLSDLAPVGCVAPFDAKCSIDDWCVEERNAPYAGISRARPLAS